MALPASFPVIPAPPHYSAWPGDVQTGYTSIRNLYTHAVELLSLDDTDPLRLRFQKSQSQNLMSQMIRSLRTEHKVSYVSTLGL